MSFRHHDDTPRQASYRDRFDDVERSDVNNGHIVRKAVGGQQVFAVWGECHLPDALTNKQVFLYRVGLGVDHCHAVCRAKGNERCRVIIGKADADGLDALGTQTLNAESDRVCDYMFYRIDNTDRATELRGDPDFRAVVPELGDAGPGTDQNAGHHLTGGEVKEVRHVGGLRRVNDRVAVGADRHALRFNTGWDLVDHFSCCYVDDGDEVVVLVRHVEWIAGGVEGKGFGVRTRGQIADHLQGFR